jgi:hypothetical protein
LIKRRPLGLNPTKPRQVQGPAAPFSPAARRAGRRAEDANAQSRAGPRPPRLIYVQPATAPEGPGRRSGHAGRRELAGPDFCARRPAPERPLQAAEHTDAGQVQGRRRRGPRSLPVALGDLGHPSAGKGPAWEVWVWKGKAESNLMANVWVEENQPF